MKITMADLGHNKMIGLYCHKEHTVIDFALTLVTPSLQKRKLLCIASYPLPNFVMPQDLKR